jgi:hypothetical protein
MLQCEDTLKRKMEHEHAVIIHYTDLKILL